MEGAAGLAGVKGPEVRVPGGSARARGGRGGSGPGSRRGGEQARVHGHVHEHEHRREREHEHEEERLGGLRLGVVWLAQIGTVGTGREPDAGLMESMGRYGLLEPIDLREAAEGGYQLVHGSRRRIAAGRLGWATITAIVEPGAPAGMALELKALLLNLHRESLQQLHLGRQARRLLEGPEWTQAKLARQLGIGRSTLCQMLAVLGCPDLVMAVEVEGLEFGAAKRMAALPPDARRALLAELRESVARDGRFPPVRAVERRVRELQGRPPLPAFTPGQLGDLVAALAAGGIPVEIESLPGRRSGARVELRLTKEDAAALRRAQDGEVGCSHVGTGSLSGGGERKPRERCSGWSGGGRLTALRARARPREGGRAAGAVGGGSSAWGDVWGMSHPPAPAGAASPPRTGATGANRPTYRREARQHDGQFLIQHRTGRSSPRQRERIGADRTKGGVE